MGIKVGMVGVGSFAQSFIPLFQAHPLVAEVVLCDVDAAKLAENARKWGIAKTLPSLDALCESEDIDAAVIITQNWLHAPQAVQALRAGKHVYSAVPAGITVEEIRALVETVEETGAIYMLGETSYYYPGAVYCRQRLPDFGHVVYAEGEYYHDWDHGLYDVMKWRGGDRWREFAGAPPMHYPTHSVGQALSVVGGRMTHVSCQGFADRHESDGIYRADVNRWGNVFSDQTALFKMSNGGMCRINEFRRIGHPGTERMSLYGTEGCFEDSGAGKVWLTKDRQATLRLDDLLRCGKVSLPTGNREGMNVLPESDAHFSSLAPVHDVERLPRAFAGLPNGHNGSHQFLVEDFVQAVATGNRTPPNNVWAAARYVLPGLLANESCQQGGTLLEIPDFGDPPAL